MKEVKLPSGAVLRIGTPSFLEAKDVWQAAMKEAKALNLHVGDDFNLDFIKDLLIIGFSSPLVEEKVWTCFRHCTYNKVRIDDKTFESVEARQDYFTVFFEVAKEAVAPFTKGLFAGWSGLIKEITENLVLRLKQKMNS